MKKSKLSIFLLVLLSVLIVTLVSCKDDISSNGNSKPINYIKIEDGEVNTYDIKVDLNTSDMTYHGEQYITYLNKSEDSLNEIYFHLYPNAFKTLEDAPILFDLAYTMDELDYVGGYIDIEKVRMDDMLLDFMVERNSEILKIKLPKPLKSGEKTKIYLQYNVKLPTSKDRFGYHDRGINLGNWYPVSCIYDKNGWHLDPYYKVGDPFFSEVSNYNVDITVPKNIELAASGVVLSEDIEGKNKTYSIKGDNIRDFAFACSEEFVISTRQVDDTLIKLYSITDNQEVMDIALDFGEDSIRVFNERFGKYPYKEYKIVNTEFPSGMEYPGIVFISNDYFNESMIDLLELVIVHETANQWWYGIIGTDQINESWIDEGLATYSEVIYMNEIYGKKVADMHYNQNIKSMYTMNSGFLGEDKTVNKSLKEFVTWNDYSMLAYSKGVGFFHEIGEKYGRDTLYNILSETYNRYKFRNITSDEFIVLCEKITGDSMEKLVKRHLE